MSIFKKLRGSLSSNKMLERLELDPEVEKELETLYGSKLATSDEGILYGGIDDLNDYLFFEAVILTRVNIKTLNGATLQFKGVNDFVLNSDTQEITSDFSKVTHMYMTNVSFDITQKEIDFIKAQQYDTVELSFKKKTLTMFQATSKETSK